MKPTLVKKFLAFVLAACTLVAVLVCGGYALMLDSYNLYNITPEEKLGNWYTEAGYPVAWRAASEAAAIGPGECSKALAEQLFGFSNTLDKEHYYVEVRQGNEIVHTVSEPVEKGVTCEYTLSPPYPKVVNIRPAYSPSTTAPQQDTETTEQTPTFPGITLPDDEPVRVEEVDVWEDLQKLIYELYYYDDSPTYTVSVTMAPEALKDTFYSNISTLYPYRYTLIWGGALALLAAAATVVYLICIAGRTKEGEICPGGLNRLPLDAYLAAAGCIAYFPVQLGVSIFQQYNSMSFLSASVLLLCGIFVCMLLLAWIFALSAQVKMGGGFWWRHTLLGRLCKAISALLSMMPVVWQWLLTAAVMALATVGSFLAFAQGGHSSIIFILCCVVCLGVICYGGYCFGAILIGARKMSRGDLQYKIPSKHLFAGFRDCAQQLNALSEAAYLAAQNQIRSERMKTELITNVSHDIKTPLTSIINFVDLLEKPHSEPEGKQYLEVLSRQSRQLKKLIEDLMELSKATTGNMKVNITTLDAVESVNQALGELSDKLDAAGLTPVLRVPDSPVHIRADGRLTWRVLSNLLSNVVKYSTPNTRVYVEVGEEEEKAFLSIKNISREELTVSPEELMERFVQGDVSRKTEGNGLGLNIAKSLMEVQHGELQLLLDGDLFKVTLVFPKA